MGSLVTNNGKNMMLHRTFTASPTQTAPTVFMIGTGTDEPQVTNTALTTEITGWNGGDTKVFETNYPTFNTTNKEVEVRGRVTSTQANGNNIAETGLFNTDGSRVILDRAVFNAISKSSTDDVIFIWKVRVLD